MTSSRACPNERGLPPSWSRWRWCERWETESKRRLNSSSTVLSLSRCTISPGRKGEGWKGEGREEREREEKGEGREEREREEKGEGREGRGKRREREEKEGRGKRREEKGRKTGGSYKSDSLS